MPAIISSKELQKLKEKYKREGIRPLGVKLSPKPDKVDLVSQKSRDMAAVLRFLANTYTSN